MERVRLSPIRRFTLWWMRPGSRYVSSSVAIDFSHAQRFLEEVRGQGHDVSVQHLVCGAIARLYTEFPVANRRIVGTRIYQAPDVGIACPVNLVGHAGEKGIGETSMVLLEAVDRLTLREIAAASRRSVATERSGQLSNPVARRVMGALQNLPGPLFRGGLRGIDLLTRTPGTAQLGWKLAPVTTAVTNVGATYTTPAGVLARAASYEPPHRILHVGSLWGIGAVQDEVIPVDGVPAVRPMLPVFLVFDHRLFDGAMASRMLARFAELLRDPTQLPL